MFPIKKILFVSCSAGMGHDRAAEALYLTCQKLYPQIQCQLLNIADCVGPQTKKVFTSSYDKLVNNQPWLYGLIFKLTDNQFWTKLAYLLSFIFYPLAKQINQQIIDFNPDVIISTHFYTGYILSKKITTPLYTVITDYYPKVHKIWLAPKVSQFFLALTQIKQELDKRKLNSVASGIPIHPSFGQKIDKEKTKNTWGLNANWPTILFMPTIKGKINIFKAVKTILDGMKKINLIIITGKNNQNLFEKLSTTKNTTNNLQNLLILRQTKQVADLMKIADIIITKAGGLTLSECLHLQKPTIIINSIPGQETHNANYFIQQGWANTAGSEEELTSKIKETLSDNVSFLSSNFYGNQSANEKILTEIFNHNPNLRTVV